MRTRFWYGALAGLLAAAVALGIGQLLGAITVPQAAPVTAVGSALIRWSPGAVEHWAVRNLGGTDKPLLTAGVLVAVAVLAGLLGGLAVARRWIGYLGVTALGVLGIAAAVTAPDGGVTDAVPSLLGGAAGLGVLALLLARTPGNAADWDIAIGTQRRRFLGYAAGSVVVTALATYGGKALSASRVATANSRAKIRIPRPASPAKPLPAGTQLDVSGLAPWRTPLDSFYRVDTALTIPQLPAEHWSLRVHGMVDRTVALTYAELTAMPMIERDITICCVSNPVGGPYIGNARWIGVPLRAVLDRAGVHSGADQIVSRSSDGMTIGTPTAVVLDGRDAMLAVAMDGQPLPIEHGFPVRMIVPGLYGYVSACKWIVEMELTTFGAYNAYWVPRGYSAQAPIKTESRIDTPHDGSTLSAGTVPIAGVAWAQHRGISKVEVQVDAEPWRTARLAAVPTADTWRQWVLDWQATPGQHLLQVRATDGTGATQTSAVTDVAPNGATGYHQVDVTVH